MWLYNRTSSTIVAIIMLPLLLVGLWAFAQAGISNDFWLGIIISLILVILIALRSLHVSKRGLTPKEAANVAKNTNILKRYFGLVLVGIVLLRMLLKKYMSEPSDIFMGATLGLMLFISILILVDNLLLRSIFIWNLQDKRVKKILRS